MKIAVILLAAVATVHSSAIHRSGRQGWSSLGWSSTTAAPGWSSTPPPTTAGWSSTPPPSTAGWSSPPPTTAGWSSPPPTTAGWSSTPPPTTAGWSTPGWSGGKVGGWSSPAPVPAGWAAPPSLTTIDLNAALAAAGSGWAAENHAENVQVIGAGGWGGPNAELAITAVGESVVEQEGEILQVTSQDAEQASSLNTVSVEQVAEASEGEVLDALGLDISNAQSGWAGAAGEGASAAEATSSIVVEKKK